MTPKKPIIHDLDHVFIEDLELLAQVGDTPEERAFPQIIVLSLHIYLTLKSAGEKDDISKTIDYAHVINRIKEKTAGRSFVLIEGLIEYIAQEILSMTSVTKVRVKGSKKIFPEAKLVGACITRQRG